MTVDGTGVTSLRTPSGTGSRAHLGRIPTEGRKAKGQYGPWGGDIGLEGVVSALWYRL